MFLLATGINTSPSFNPINGFVLTNESRPAGEIINVDISATDADQDDVLTFEITSDFAKYWLKLEPSNQPRKVYIVTKQVLDRESVDKFDVSLKVSDGNGNSDQTSFTLIVLDINDNAPQFVGQPYEIFVSENEESGRHLFTVNTTDADNSPFNIVTCALKNNLDTFELTSTGRLTLINTLDYEKIKFYQLHIIAMNKGTGDTGNLNSTTNILVHVVDEQDTPPKFQNLPNSIEIFENATMGQVIYSVLAVDGDKGVLNPNRISYDIVSGSFENITLNSDTGELTLSGSLDREHPDLIGRFGSINLVIKATEVEQVNSGVSEKHAVSTSTLNIKVIDINDNKPTFNAKIYVGKIIENSQEGAVVLLNPPLIVRDPDEGPHGIMNVTLFSDIFILSPKNLIANEASLLLRVSNSTALDYEQNTNFTFDIEVKEHQTNEEYSNTATIIVQVIDINDNWPVFDNSDPYVVSILENSPINTFVANISATDKDSGTLGEISYYIRGADAQKFIIDLHKGIIKVGVKANEDHTLLDRETKEKIFLIVDAIDGGGYRSSLSLAINLTDENDNPPKFSRTSYDGYARENSADFESKIIFIAEDPDENHKLEFTIQGSNLTDLFYVQQLSPFTARLNIVKPIDYESLNPSLKGNLSFNVIVSDVSRTNPSTSLNSSVPLNIYILDLNDETPVFVKPSHNVSIKENATEGDSVFTVKAKDGDLSSPNNDIFYRIETGSRDQFQIDPNSGLITVDKMARLDRDIIDEYEMIVVAIDRGIQTNTGTTTIYLQIEDVNNKIPFFNPMKQSIAIYENVTIGSEIYTVKAFDSDLNSDLTYSIKSVTGMATKGLKVDDLSSVFSVENKTGVVKTRKKLNREEIKTFSIDIFVSDMNAFQPEFQNSTMTLTVELKDVNDNPPKFEKSEYYANSLREDAKINSPVITVNAVDEDDPATDNAKIQYSIDNTSTNASGLFGVDEKTGSVFVSNSLVNKTGMRLITVLATDKGTPSLSSSTLVKVYVEDVNDQSPKIIHPDANKILHVLENEPEGTFIEHFKVANYDTESDEEMLFELKWTPDNDYREKFHIDPKTGILATSKVLDREEKKEYLLHVQASIDQKEDNRIHRLEIADKDDNLPSFNRDLYKIPYIVRAYEEKENVAIANLSLATDPDVNSSICYYLAGGAKPWKDHFSLKKDTGILMINKKLDRERVNMVDLVVKADPDCFTNKWQNASLTFNISDSTELLVHILIQDINDNPPFFVKSSFVAGVSKESEFGSEVLNLQTVSIDYDINENANLTWYIISNFRLSPTLKTHFPKDSLPFTIIPHEGIIKTNVYFKTEWEGNIKFDVRVNDSNPSHVDNATISVYLLNEKQRVIVTVLLTAEEVNKRKEHFSKVMSNITGYIINVDTIRIHQSSQSTPDKNKADMFIHAINQDSGTVIDSVELIKIIEEKKTYNRLVPLFRQYNVIEVKEAFENKEESTENKIPILVLVSVVVLLFLIIIIISVIFYYNHKKDKRKLKSFKTYEITNGRTKMKESEIPTSNLQPTLCEGTNPSWLTLEGQTNFGVIMQNNSDDEGSIESNVVGPDLNYEEQRRVMTIYPDCVTYSNGCSNNVNKIANTNYAIGLDLKNGPNIEITDI
ncbi:DgyrCDS12075 [Dimorphilus gyrociliatus]|uniref:DgyrCDS12075 n=1 Tax=Dimorphilus gyrociliatus TaxID=2664684 RepID=A0A7I8W5D7_9ANNE|nr:DgyrCDS12075 [Dimorphilus gyrociliatus]